MRVSWEEGEELGRESVEDVVSNEKGIIAPVLGTLFGDHGLTS